ncbi:MAG: amino acid ABC transporter permease [Rhodospirillales bacterium]|nr:amino acid ABC transporter permease [Rhodospirillales bacterium]
MKWQILWEYRWALLSGLWITLWISAVSIVGATIIGALVGWLSTWHAFVIQRLTAMYMEVIRNIPAVVKLFVLYFLAGLDATTAGVATLILHQSAYIADITAAGLRSIPSGQREAALSCGHSDAQVFLYVLIPQAVRVVIPPLTSQYIEVVKNSAIVMLIAIQDLTFQTQQIESETFRGFEAATAVTLAYLVIALIISTAMSWLQKATAKP